MRSSNVSLQNRPRGRTGTRLYCFIVIVSLCATAVFLLFVHLEDATPLSTKKQFMRQISPYLHVPLDLMSSTFSLSNETSTEIITKEVQPAEHLSQDIEDVELNAEEPKVTEEEKQRPTDDTVYNEFYGQENVVSNGKKEKKPDDDDDYDEENDDEGKDTTEEEFYGSSEKAVAAGKNKPMAVLNASPTASPTQRIAKTQGKKQSTTTIETGKKPRDFSINSKGKPKKKAKKYAGTEIWDYQSDWGSRQELPFIEMMPTKKIMLKKDRRVVFPNLTLPALGGRGDEVLHALEQYEDYALRDTADAGEQQYLSIPLSYVMSLDEQHSAKNVNQGLVEAETQLSHHIFQQNKSLGDGYSVLLSEAMATVSRSESCGNRPVFLGMATAKDDLYRQLIDNFFYSLTRFHLSGCGMLVCVSDPSCVSLCQQRKFACYNYTENKDTKSVMEQIAIVKLQHVPQALQLNVSVFMLDLDVGWLHSPTIMLRAFSATPLLDVLVQEDMIFIMNRSKAGWRQWHTEPLPNIGLFLLRGNHRTARAMEIAWEKYAAMDDDYEKRQPGKDQNHVLDAVRIMRGIGGLKYAYLDNSTAPLLDKLVLKHGNAYELGGELMSSFLQTHRSLAVHATCYEKSTKVHGLRVAGGFWSPRHYDPHRRTITAPLLWQNSEAALLAEVRTLAALAVLLDRALIIPNLIADPLDHSLDGIDLYRGQRMWPSFRVLAVLDSTLSQSLTLLEAGFYWRVQRDYATVPEPLTLTIPGSMSFAHMLRMLQDPDVDKSERLVLSVLGPGVVDEDGGKEIQRRLSVWSHDSVGQGLGSGLLVPSIPLSENETAKYQHEIFQQLRRIHRPLPILPPSSALKWTAGLDAKTKSKISQVVQGTRLCRRVFDPPRGNRTCFQVCD